jgi:hypothetical protein
VTDGDGNLVDLDGNRLEEPFTQRPSRVVSCAA